MAFLFLFLSTWVPLRYSLKFIADVQITKKRLCKCCLHSLFTHKNNFFVHNISRSASEM